VLDDKYVSGACGVIFQFAMHGFTSNNKAVPLYFISIIIKIIGIATWGGIRGAAAPFL